MRFVSFTKQIPVGVKVPAYAYQDVSVSYLIEDRKPLLLRNFS